MQSRIVIAVRKFRCERSACITPTGSISLCKVLNSLSSGDLYRNSTKPRLRFSLSLSSGRHNSSTILAAAATLALSSDTRLSGQKPNFKFSAGSEEGFRATDFMARKAQVLHRTDPAGADGDCTSHLGLNSMLAWESVAAHVMSVIKVP